MYDTKATWEVLEKQIEKYKLQPDVLSLAELSRAGNHKILDMAGRIAINSKGKSFIISVSIMVKQLNL